ncbi:MAG: DUF4838 domain-containing protein [Clostridia bacterium]|nr:DUF4838 domain-containing protein [Clostridia bacterium]
MAKSKRGVVLLMTDFCEEWLDIYKESGLNFLGLHTIVKECTNDDYVKWAESDEVRALIKKFEDAGITVEHELHVAYSLLPRNFIETSPNMFREVDGVRTNDYNLCVSSKEAIDIVEFQAFMLAKALGQTSPYYHFWSDDKAGAWCKCEKCKNTTAGNQTYAFTEAVMRGIKKYNPDARECYLAYQDMRAKDVKKNDGLFLEFAPIHRVLTEPITAEANRGDRELLLDQMKYFDKTYILDYWLDESLFSGWNRANISELPDLERIIREDVRYYETLGVEAITTFAAYVDSDYFKRYGKENIIRYCKALAE